MSDVTSTAGVRGLVGFSSRPLRAGEVVRHGDGLVTHTTQNTPVDDLYDALIAWTVGVDVPASGLVMCLNAAGTIEPLGGLS